MVVSVGHKRISSLFVFWLILLLGVQLTGLSCWEELQLVPTPECVLANPPIPGAAPMTEGPVNDGCPCHMAFASAPTWLWNLVSPDSPLITEASASPPAVPPITTFHPPLAL